MDTVKLDSSLLCAHTYTPHPLISTTVSRIRILGVPYDDCVVRVKIHQYSVCPHPAHVRVQIDN